MTELSLLAKGDEISDRYVVVGELGRGGMAFVYLCDDRVTGERVAVKVLFAEPGAATQRHAVWFYQEARALAALEHPAIVRARDFGALPDGSLFLVMDTVRGRTLHAWRERGPLPYGVVWEVADQVLAGLAHAHARGVIHGDLKPSNVMLAPGDSKHASPRAYVLDLGLAWLFENRTDPRLSEATAGPPALPVGSGTAGWLAPEQIRRATPHIGPPTDLYALGCILYELLTGHEVFEGEAGDVLRAHRDARVPEPSLPRDAPHGVAAFVTRLLAKRPWRRFRLAADAREVWQGFRPSSPVLWNVSIPDGWVDRALVSSDDVVPTSMRVRIARGLSPGIVSLRPCPVMGRDHERAHLVKLIDDVALGRGPARRGVLLEGQAGVGKSRLAEFACEHAHEHGRMTPLRVRFSREPGELDALRYAAFLHYKVVGCGADVVERVLLNEWEVERNDNVGRAWASTTAAWLCYVEKGAASSAPPYDSEHGWGIATHLLARVAVHRPLLLWLDDAQSAAPHALEGFARVVAALDDVDALVVVTARAEAIAADGEARAGVDALRAALPFETMSVTPLDATAMRALLRATLALAPEDEAVVLARSHGNPLFALQLVHAWADGGHLTPEGGIYRVSPDALHAQAPTTTSLWEARLSALPPALRPAAEAASALGIEVASATLEALLDALGFDAPEVVTALERAEILLPEQGHRLRWAHPLFHAHAQARLAVAPDVSRILACAEDALDVAPDSRARAFVQRYART